MLAISEVKRRIAAEVQQFASADDRVRHIQPDAHVTVRQNRTILNRGPVIHLTKTLYIAEAVIKVSSRTLEARPM